VKPKGCNGSSQRHECEIPVARAIHKCCHGGDRTSTNATTEFENLSSFAWSAKQARDCKMGPKDKKSKPTAAPVAAENPSDTPLFRSMVVRFRVFIPKQSSIQTLERNAPIDITTFAEECDFILSLMK
jgi:hypothetical protein